MTLIFQGFVFWDFPVRPNCFSINPLIKSLNKLRIFPDLPPSFRIPCNLKHMYNFIWSYLELRDVEEAGLIFLWLIQMNHVLSSWENVFSFLSASRIAKSLILICIVINITKTCLYNFDPLKPHFYIVKLGFTGVYIIFLISAQKHRLWVLVRTASPRRF